MDAMLKNKRKSDVWKYFLKTVSGGQCKFCHKELKSCGNTTNLLNHVIRKHNVKRGNTNGSTISTNSNYEVVREGDSQRAGSSSSRPDNLSSDVDVIEIDIDDTNSIMSNISSCDDEPCNQLNTESRDFNENVNFAESGTGSGEAGPTQVECVGSVNSNCSRISSSSKFISLQQTIDKSFSEIYSYKDGGNKSNLLNEALAFMICIDNLPLNTTDKEGFQYFMKKALPHFKLPGRTKMTQLIDDRYHIISNEMKQKLKSIQHFSVTVDVWTDTINTRSFLGGTIHFVSGNTLTSVVIALEELTESHTSEFLLEILRKVFSDWCITNDKICAMVTDNGANIVKAVTNIVDKNRHLPCFAHTLNLVAQKVCEEESVSQLLSSVKAIVTYFKHSVAASDELRKVSDLKLVQSVVTRWNSSFLMLERFLKLRDAVGTILLRFPKSPRMLSAAEIQDAQEVIHLLKPIEVVSREECGDRYVTASKIIPLVNILNQQVSALKPETEVGQLLKTAFIREMNKRFGKVEEVQILAISTLLDPRFKRIHFKNPIAVSNAIAKIKTMCEHNDQVIEGATTFQDSQVDNEDENDNIWNVHKKMASAASCRLKSTSNDELHHFLSQNLSAIYEDPIQFWDKFKLTYPVLAPIALKFLVIVGTSVPSERLFSRAGNIMEPSRNRLTGSRLSKLVFLNSVPIEDWYLPK